MLPSLPARPAPGRLTAAAFMAAQVLGLITHVRASDQAARPAAPLPSPAAPTVQPAVRLALREFDRFLDHHPLLEDRLRLDARLTTNGSFLEKNPELRDFLRANPNVGEGLKVYPRYFLNRALLRQASAPVAFVDLAPFRDLFQREPALERELTKNPELVRDPAFVGNHAVLREFFVQHPPLARVFLPSSPRSAHL